MAKWIMFFFLLLPLTVCFGIKDSEGNVDKLVFNMLHVGKLYIFVVFGFKEVKTHFL